MNFTKKSLNSIRRFYFIRHGETDYLKLSKFYRKSSVDLDLPLNNTGILQAEKVGTQLSDLIISKNIVINNIISSPLKRALKTASIISDKINYSGVITESSYLKEVTNITLDHSHQVDNVINLIESLNTPNTIIVGHSNLFKLLTRRLFQTDYPIPNCSVMIIDYYSHKKEFNLVISPVVTLDLIWLLDL